MGNVPSSSSIYQTFFEPTHIPRYDLSVTLPCDGTHGCKFIEDVGDDKQGPVLVARVQEVAEGGSAQGLLLLNDHVMRLDDDQFGVKNIGQVVDALGGTVSDEESKAATVTLHLARERTATVVLRRRVAVSTTTSSTRSPSTPRAGVEMTVAARASYAGAPAASAASAAPFGLELSEWGNRPNMPWGGRPVHVSAIVPGSEAATCGLIAVGDRLEAIDGAEVFFADRARSELAEVGAEVTLFFVRHDYSHSFADFVDAVRRVKPKPHAAAASSPAADAEMI